MPTRDAGAVQCQVELIGPGGAGKSTIGALLADRLGLASLDLDRHRAGPIGDISEYIDRFGYRVSAAWSEEKAESRKAAHQMRRATYCVVAAARMAAAWTAGRAHQGTQGDFVIDI
jgi:hypothetical protein